MSQEPTAAKPPHDRAPTGAIRDFLRSFLPFAQQVDARERWRAALGAGLGILLAGLLTRWTAAAEPGSVWLIAPMGAAAVLVFAVPGSPLAQPWSVLGGNTVSALVGIACVHLIPDTAWAAATAVALAIGLMFVLRCLHPPGGATALLVVLIHATSFRFALVPVFVNSLVLTLAGIAYNSLTGRPYPHPLRARGAPPAAPRRFNEADLDAALAHYNEVLDINREDLGQLLHYAEIASLQRKLGTLRCADIMSPQPVAVHTGTSLQEAWTLMREQGIKALPVVDRTRRVVGIVTAKDFLAHIEMDEHSGIAHRLRSLLRREGSHHHARREVVGDIMTRRVQVAGAQRPVAELLPLFAEGNHRHVPIIDDEHRLQGIVTQSDLLRALYRAVAPVAEAAARAGA